MTTEAELAVEIIGERLCPSAKVDTELREQLIGLRPEPGEAGQMIPHLAVETIEGDDQRGMTMIPVLEDVFWNSKDAKRSFIRKIGAHFSKEKRQPLVVYLLSEAWVKTWPKGEKPQGPIDLELQEVKREVIVAVALTIDGRTGEAHAEILRDAEARISGYGEIESIACGSLQENGEPAAEAGILKPFFYGYVQALRLSPRDA